MAMLNNQRVVTVCFNELHSMIPYLEMAGRAKENFPGASLKYLFVYLDVVTVVFP